MENKVNILTMANKRGQGLPLSTVVIAILVVLVLIVIVGFFLGGTSGLTKTIKTVFFGTTAGTDKVLAIQTCDQRCQQAETLPVNQQQSSAFCKKAFRIDDNGDGEADTVNNEGKVYIDWYCHSNVGGSAKGLGANCPGLASPCETQTQESAASE